MWAGARGAQAILVGVALLAAVVPARGQDTFVDPAGRFSIDIPSTYVLASSANGPLFQFRAGILAKEGGPRIILLFQATGTDLSTGFQEARKLMDQSLRNTAPVSPVQDLTLNSNPARMGLYSGEVQAKTGGAPVRLFAFIASAVMKQGNAVFLAFMNAGQREKWEADLREVFLTLREENEPVMGAQNVRVHKP